MFGRKTFFCLGHISAVTEMDNGSNFSVSKFVKYPDFRKSKDNKSSQNLTTEALFLTQLVSTKKLWINLLYAICPVQNGRKTKLTTGMHGRVFRVMDIYLSLSPSNLKFSFKFSLVLKLYTGMTFKLLKDKLK